MHWDEWRGSLDGRPTVWIKHLVVWGDCRLDLHKFIVADDVGCFHTHNAWALRIVLWGGYYEEVPDRFIRAFWPGRVGLIAPWFCHRIEGLMRGPSYSLWIRGPKVAEIQLHGPGWS